MVKRIWSMLSSVGGVALALSLSVAPAHASEFTLTQWNVSEFETAGATLEVHVGLNGGNTEITFTFNPGTLANTFLGLDQIGYNGAPALTGTDGFSLGNGNLDGFGSYDFKYVDGANLGLPTFTIAGDHVSAFTGFAAHLRFEGIPSGSCSGFVDTTNVDTHSESGCTTASVTEPAVLAFVGFGLVGAVTLGRRWRRGDAGKIVAA
jgi:hypothetical protein